MPLEFPNPSRSYDADNRRVRFIGHDGMVSVPFAVEVMALQKSGSHPLVGEAQSLAAFDAMRPSIHDVAREAYARVRQTTYVLGEADF